MESRTAEERFHHAGSCPHCASLNKVDKPKYSVCQDCGAVFKGGEVLRAGFLDIHYVLEIQMANGRPLWTESLAVLFEAQCDVAAGLKINPGSSFAKWLKSHDPNDSGVIEKPDVLETVSKITQRILKHAQYIRDPYILQAVERLGVELPRAARLIVTLKRK